jgi:hypothetical protein
MIKNDPPHPSFEQDYAHPTPPDMPAEQLNIQRLCYETFILNPAGQELMAILAERILMVGLGNMKSPKYEMEVLYFEGYKDAIRAMRNMALAHEKIGEM